MMIPTMAQSTATALTFLSLIATVVASPRSELNFSGRGAVTAGIFPSRSSFRSPAEGRRSFDPIPARPLLGVLRCGASSPGGHLSAGAAKSQIPPSPGSAPPESPVAGTPNPQDWNTATTDDETEFERSHFDGVAEGDRSASYAKRLKSRNSMHIRRKVTHAAFGVSFSLLRRIFGRRGFCTGMGIVTFLTLLIEVFRYRRGFGWMNDVLHWICGGILRKHEMNGKFTGAFYYFLGCTAAAALFPGNAAIFGMMQLALADPSASYFGKKTKHVYWSRIENGLGGLGRNKGILGFLGGALFCIPFNYEMLSVATWPGGVPSIAVRLAASALIGTAGSFADLSVPTPAITMPPRICGIRMLPFHIDDNFVVPIVSAFGAAKVFDHLGMDFKLARFIFI
mmetsp:Transcript_43224/g.84913  ORF Transcript_43224/g.84913 Transcript_43224/m.84913 type:complete len:396 (+) Transcript_43224:143-1330(+)